MSHHSAESSLVPLAGVFEVWTFTIMDPYCSSTLAPNARWTTQVVGFLFWFLFLGTCMPNVPLTPARLMSTVHELIAQVD